MSVVNNIDPFETGVSLIYQLDARVKLVLTMAFIITCNLIPTGKWLIFAAPALFALVIVLFSKLEVKKIILRSFLVLPFILAAFPLIFTLPGEPLFSFQFLNIDFVISNEGLLQFAFILLKSWFSILISVILVMSTPFSELLKSLKWLRIPGLIVAVIGLMWRYLFVIVDEAKRLLIARSARSGSVTGRKSGGRLIWRAKVSGGLAGNLFLRSIRPE